MFSMSISEEKPNRKLLIIFIISFLSDVLDQILQKFLIRIRVCLLYFLNQFIRITSFRFFISRPKYIAVISANMPARNVFHLHCTQQNIQQICLFFRSNWNPILVIPIRAV